MHLMQICLQKPSWFLHVKKSILKIIVTSLFVFFFSFTYAQKGNFERLLADGNAEFTESFEEQDYSFAVKVLERAVHLKPENTEVIKY